MRWRAAASVADERRKHDVARNACEKLHQVGRNRPRFRNEMTTASTAKPAWSTAKIHPVTWNVTKPSNAMICRAKSMPIRFNTMVSTRNPTMAAIIAVSPAASPMNTKIAATPQGVTIIGIASGVTAGCVQGPDACGPGRLN